MAALLELIHGVSLPPKPHDLGSLIDRAIKETEARAGGGRAIHELRPARPTAPQPPLLG